MGDVIRRLVWFFVIASAVSYATFLVAGNLVNAQAASAASAIVVRDELGAGVHHLSGMVMVPSSCFQLSVRADTVSDTTYNLTFRTWEDPAIDCSPEEVPRHFNTVLFAPAAGVNFFATLDGAVLPLAVIPIVADSDLP